MKTMLLVPALATLAFVGSASAQTAATLQTYTGQVVNVSPQGSSLMISDGTAQPVAYTYTRETQFVDGAGNAVTYEAIRQNTPVRVEYVPDGEVRRVQRVIVQPAAAATTTTVVQPAPVVQPVTQQQTTTTTTVTREEEDD